MNPDAPKFLTEIIHNHETVFRIADGRLDHKYTLLQPDGDPAQETNGVKRVEAIGGGTFGVIVRAKDALDIPRAIKLLKFPRPTERASSDTSTNLFVNEVLAANASVFKNVVPIIAYGTDHDWIRIDQRGTPFYYHVSPYVNGVTFQTVIDGLWRDHSKIESSEVFRNRVHDLVLTVFKDILSAVEELSRSQIVHMDIKPSNIMMCPGDNNPLGIGKELPAHKGRFGILDAIPLQAFVIDMGAAKFIGDNHAGKTPFICSEKYFPCFLTKGNSAELPITSLNGFGSIRYEHLRKCWKAIDVHCCGRTFEIMLLDQIRRQTFRGSANQSEVNAEEIKELFWRRIFGDEFGVIEAIIDRMLAEPQENRYLDAKDVKDAFATIPLKAEQRILASEMLTDRQPGLKIRAGNALVKVSSPFERIVDHSCFQRLRLRQQLAMVSCIYPDATHSRFVHSLRTFHLAKKYVLGLNKNSSFRFLFGRKDVETLLAASLLHDLGQYPFSHTIEDLRKMGELCGDATLTKVAHDQQVAREVIKEEDKGVSISDLLEDHGISTDDVIYIIDKQSKQTSRGPVLNICRDLVSGTIDVDRLSYLIQDSDRTGVPYGIGIDIDSLIDSLTIKVNLTNLTDAGAGLGIRETGVSAVESVLAAVYWMYRNVYWRHTNRAFMAAVKWVVRHLLKSKAMTFESYWSDTNKISDWEALRYLDTKYQKFLGKRKEVNPLSELVCLRRIGYRRVSSIRYEEKDDGTPTNEGKLYEKLVMGITAQREDDLIEVIRKHLPNNAEAKPGDILVDVPLKPRLHGIRRKKSQEPTAESGRFPELWVECRSPLLRRTVNWVRIEDYSPLARTLRTIEDHSGRKVRVFLSRSVLGHLDYPDDWEKIEKNMQKWLDEATASWGIDVATGNDAAGAAGG